MAWSDKSGPHRESRVAGCRKLYIADDEGHQIETRGVLEERTRTAVRLRSELRSELEQLAEAQRQSEWIASDAVQLAEARWRREPVASGAEGCQHHRGSTDCGGSGSAAQ